MSTTALTTEDLAIFNRLHIRWDLLQAMRASHSTDYRAMLAREHQKVSHAEREHVAREDRLYRDLVRS